ncbi:adenylate/guanylate cyclase domain-containing protein [Oceaniferula flava]
MWWLPVMGDFLAKQERMLRDFFTAHDHRLKPREDFVFLGIDSASLTLDGPAAEVVAGNSTLEKMSKRYPWDRRVYAEAIDRLANAGAKLIIIDLVFPQGATAEEDEALAAAIARHRNKVVLASAFMAQAAGDQQTVTQMVEPIEPFLGPLDSETPSGYVNFWPHYKDRLVREVQLSKTLREVNNQPRRSDEPVFVPLSVAAARQLGKEPTAPSQIARFRMARVQGRNVDEVYEPQSLYRIFVPSDWQQYREAAFFQDKVVIIGPAAPTFQDAHDTPAGKVYGAQLHLHALGAILEDAWYREGLLGDGLLLRWILCGVALMVSCAVAFAWSRVGRLLLALSVAFVLWLGTAYFTCYFTGVVIGGVPWMATTSSGIFGAMIWQAITERARRQQLHRHLQRSMSPDVADAIVKAPSGYYAAASGNRKEVTVLFADVRDFTTRSEQQDAVQLVSQLNEYLEKMVEVIFAHGGTVDKFIGDAIMATWGGLDRDDSQAQAEASVQAAKGMLHELAKLNAKWASEGLEPFHIGIGIHHGEAVVGEVGSDQRTDFTVIGDAVNLASRTEGLTKKLAVELLISSAVYAHLTEPQGWVEVLSVRVKGRDAAVSLYTPFPHDDQQRLVLEAGVAAFRSGDLSKATAHFAELEAAPTFAGVARFYQQELMKLSAGTKTPPGWDGVIRMDSK